MFVGLFFAMWCIPFRMNGKRSRPDPLARSLLPAAWSPPNRTNAEARAAQGTLAYVHIW